MLLSEPPPLYPHSIMQTINDNRHGLPTIGPSPSLNIGFYSRHGTLMALLWVVPLPKPIVIVHRTCPIVILQTISLFGLSCGAGTPLTEVAQSGDRTTH